MDKLLPYYERELALLRGYLQEAAHKHPRLARLVAAIDPGIERVIQATALLCARLSYKLDHATDRFTGSLLSAQEPYYLRPLPACSIVQIDPPAGSPAVTIQRGTELKTTTAPVCRFRTAYDVTIAPLAVTSARFTTINDVPGSLRLPSGIGGQIVLTIGSTDPALSLAEAATLPLRLYIDADASIRTSLHDTLFMRTLCTCAVAGSQWHKLAALPIQPVGFEAGEALLPVHRRQIPGLRMLAEYFLLPEKFAFIDLDLKPALPHFAAGTRELTLHLLLPDLGQHAAGRLLRALSADMLRARCTPVINLFARKALPIRLKARRPAYPLTVAAAGEAPCTIYSVTAAKLKHRDDATVEMSGFYAPFRTLRGQYWIEQHADAALATAEEVSFVDWEQKPLQAGGGTVDADLFCTNGDVPARLPAGALTAGDATGGYPIRMLRQPTVPGLLADERDGHMKLIAALVPRYMDIARWEDLQGLLALLRLHALPGDAVTERQLSGIVKLASRIDSERIRVDRGAMLCRGLEITLTIDETAFAARSIHTLAQILDRLFSCSTASNHYTRVTIVATDGAQLLRLPVCPGSSFPL